MARWSWFKKPKSIEHHAFGTLVWDGRGHWDSDVRFPPTNSAIRVSLRAPETGPEPWHATEFEQLAVRYPDLQAAVATELFHLYQPHQALMDFNGAERGAPNPKSAEEMLALTVLEVVEIVAPDDYVLTFGFREDAGWDDAMLAVRVRDWRPEGISLDD